MLKTKKANQKTAITAFVLLVLMAILSNIGYAKVVYGISIVLFVCSGILKLNLEKNNFSDYINGTFLASILINVITLSRYSYVSGTDLPFWRFSVLTAVVSAVFFSAKALAVKRKENENTKKSVLIKTVLITFAAYGLLSFFFSHALIENLNYTLDFSQPQIYSSEIKDKNTYSVGRGGKNYEFTLTAEEKTFKLDVKKSTYKKYDIGDIFEFKRYKGLFGEPFYIQ